MRMIISSGNGPQECEKAVYEYFKYLKKEFAKYNIEYRYIESEAENIQVSCFADKRKYKIYQYIPELFYG